MFSGVYFPRINGASASLQTFRCELERLGNKVFLIAPTYDDESLDDDRTIRVESRRIMGDPEDRMIKLGKLVSRIGELEDLDFDIVHIHTPFVAHCGAIKIAKSLGIACVVTYHTLFEEYV